MVEFIERALSVVMQIINSLGYWGIAAGMALESACIPLPSEIVLPLAGNMVSSGIIDLLGANLAAALGSLTGSLAAYAIGCFGGRSFILKYSKFLFISKDHFYKAEHTFNRYGSAAVFFGRLLPVIRTFISLPAGITRMDIKKFTVYSLAGMIPWNLLLIFLGFKFGEDYETVIRPVFKKFEYVAVIAAMVVALALLLRSLCQGKKVRT